MVNLQVIKKYDDPTGSWYECECGIELFLPDFDTKDNGTDLYNFCPYCGNEILTIKAEMDS